MRSDSPWDIARRLRLCRQPPGHFRHVGTCAVIDPGVNFFVRGLEELGAQPIASCDGHGSHHQFYVLFFATYELALLLRGVGFFNVEVERPNEFSLRLNYDPSNLSQTLRWAAEAWREKLGVSGIEQDPEFECAPCVRKKRVSKKL